MPAIVSLHEIVDQLTCLDDESTAYLNKETGEVVMVSREDMSWAEEGGELEDIQDEPEWQREIFRIAIDVLDSDDYVALPGKFELDEYDIMRDFCASVAGDRLRDRLLDAIRGAGAFRRFRDAIHRFDIAEDWYRFRDAALKEIAIAWLKENHVAYADDTGPGIKRRDAHGTR